MITTIEKYDMTDMVMMIMMLVLLNTNKIKSIDFPFPMYRITLKFIHRIIIFFPIIYECRTYFNGIIFSVCVYVKRY